MRTARKMLAGLGLVPAALLVAVTVAAAPPALDEITAAPGQLVPAAVEGKPAMLRILSAGPDRLILNAASADHLGLKPALLMGRANLNVAGRREFEGRNRPVDFMIADLAAKGRAFWFPAAPPAPGDGSIGPFGLPHGRVSLVLGNADPAAKRFDFPLFGDVSNGSFTTYEEPGFGFYMAFDADDAGRYPIASAAAGAAIAKFYGGQLSGASWDVDILFGIRRPVRLLTLDRPLKIGPFMIDRIAVRVRDRIDAAGRGEDIKDADKVEDPSEIVVTANAKVKRPIYTVAIPRATMSNCQKLTFDKPARQIHLWCRPGG